MSASWQNAIGWLLLLLPGCRSVAPEASVSLEVGHDPPAEGSDTGVAADADSGPGAETDAGETDAPGDTAADSGGQQTNAARLLLTDSADAAIYVLDENGEVLDAFASPVPNPTGVAYDLRSRDGFWLVGTGDSHLYKLDMTGVVVDTRLAFGVDHVDIRGLDYWLGADGRDYLVFIATNSLGIQGAATYGLSERGTISYYSFAEDVLPDGTPDFLAGFWGVVMTDYSTNSRSWELSRWASRDDGTVAFWKDSLSQGGTEEVLSGLNDPKGIAVAATSYVVSDGDDRVYAFDEAFLPLLDFATPGTAPADISILD